VTGDHRRDRGPAAAEGHVNEVEAERQPELFAGEMRLRARSGRTEAVFAGIGLDELDKRTAGLTVTTVVDATARVTGLKSLIGS
jgi:hypothetical protein